MPFTQAALTDDLYAYWSFDAGNIFDDSGHGHTGTTTGAAWTQASCQIGGCYSLNSVATTDYINLSALANFETDITFTAWINPFDNSTYFLYSFNVGPNTVLSQYNEFTSNKKSLTFYDGTLWRLTDAKPFEEGVFHHVAWAFDADANTMKVYLDGVFSGNVTVYDGNITLESPHIGAWDATGNAIAFKGIVDDVGIWNRTLNDAEILQLSQNVTPFNANQLVLTAINSISGDAVAAFNVTFNNGSAFDTSTGNVTLVNWTNGNYTINVTALGYALNSTTFEHLNLTYIVTSLQPENELEVIFKDEVTRQPVENITYELRGPSNSFMNISTDGGAFFKNLENGLYEIRYSLNSSKYDARSYFLLVPIANTVQNNISLYVANETLTNTFLPLVYDQDYKPIVDSYLQALRYYVDINGYESVEMAQPDQQQGQAIMNLFFNTVAYKFRVYQNNTLLYQDTVPRYLADQTLTFRVQQEQGVSLPFTQCSSLQGEVLYINLSVLYNETFKFSWSDMAGNYDNYCLQVTHAQGLTTTVNTSCSVNPSAELLFNINSSKKGLFSAIGTAYADNIPCLVDSAEYQKPSEGAGVFGLMGVFIGLIVVFLGFFVSMANPAVGIIVGLAGLAAVSFGLLGLTILSVGVLMTLIAAGIALIFITKT